ncbi:MAG: glycosyltransferase family 39 protein [Nitrospirae bacterium]|nr:glycosyltransferase family 39 protein [Nitrospirota bacterium]
MYIHKADAIQHGFNLKSISWALTSVYFSNWHPVTTISYLVDYTLFGENPWWYHLENIILHIANSILLFLFLRLLTGAKIKSAIVAIIFSVHPINVESVAWVSERKNLFSTFFWLSSLIFYVQYVRTMNSNKYYAAIFTFILGIMSKPMIVTLPLTLMLLDYWPLNRFDGFLGNGRNIFENFFKDKNGILYILLEKIPFFFLSAFSSIVTISAQTDAINTIIPLGTKLLNVPVSYCMYMLKTLWPIKLAVFYPYTLHPLYVYLLCLFTLIILMAAGFLRRKKEPYLLFGLLWFLIVLLPVIQIILAGSSSIADRYMYVPIIGFALALVWLAGDIKNKLNVSSLVIAPFTGAVLVALIVLASIQVCFWKDSDTLFKHNIAIVDNVVARNNLGASFFLKKDYDKALKEFNAGLKISPDSLLISVNLAALHIVKNDVKDKNYKESLYLTVLRKMANDKGIDDVHYLRMVASSYNKAKKNEQAFYYYVKALQLEPNNKETLKIIGDFLMSVGRYNEAIQIFDKELYLSPNKKEFLIDKGKALQNIGKCVEAIKCFTDALHSDPKSSGLLSKQCQS